MEQLIFFILFALFSLLSSIAKKRREERERQKRQQAGKVVNRPVPRTRPAKPGEQEIPDWLKELMGLDPAQSNRPQPGPPAHQLPGEHETLEGETLEGESLETAPPRRFEGDEPEMPARWESLGEHHLQVEAQLDPRDRDLGEIEARVHREMRARKKKRRVMADAGSLRELLNDRRSLRNAIVLKEILEPPMSVRRLRPGNPIKR
ncbi:MAG TPA: hypothetical protein PKV71_02590 [Calditrichia bacterium]|nr:hypothetical protein [Calditrichota bacterium]HQU71276.1 hypothetical protein [Calditrichia bacterium]HQV30729.1 hypothetical protein [Calditrichia bacterium]